MATIKAEELAQLFENCIGKAPYPKTGSGTTSYDAIQNGNAVDCSGIFVACFKKLGGSIYHGSNTIWRQYLTEKGTVTDNTSSNGYKNSHKSDNPLKSSQLKVGMAVFKWNSSTPSKFNDGLGDYQHIGLVTSVNPIRIVHSSSENYNGVVVQNKIGTFCAWGKLKGVDYGEDGTEENDTEVETMSTSTKGKLRTVSGMRVRAKATVTSKTLVVVPAGTTLEFEGSFDDGWVSVTYKGCSGYMCVTSSKYATQISAPTTATDTDDDTDSTTSSGSSNYAALAAKVEDIIARLDELEEIVVDMQENMGSADTPVG